MDDAELARLIRSSRALDSLLKRQWLRLYRHLSPVDRARLAAILRAEASKQPARAAASDAPR